ncbi:MAG: DMT family transporter [Bacteroidetes bacterium]|nr:DMT family transporter [Bacteroidota bacterium]
MVTRNKALLFLSAQTFLVSLGYIITKTASTHSDPVTIMFFRAVLTSLIAAVMLRFIYRVEAATLPDRKVFLRLSFLAVFLNQGCFITGIFLTSTGEAAIIYAMVPVITYVLSLLRREEYFDWKRLSGVLVALGGVILIISAESEGLTGSHFAGNLIILAGAVTWAVYTVESRRYSVQYNPYVFSLKVLQYGILWVAPLGVWVLFQDDPAGIPLQVVWVISYLAIFGTIISYGLWVAGLKVLEPSKVAVFTNGQPIMTTLLSFLILDLSITQTFLTGSVLVISGVLVTQYSGRFGKNGS